jgi:hypothetical protein
MREETAEKSPLKVVNPLKMFHKFSTNRFLVRPFHKNPDPVTALNPQPHQGQHAPGFALLAAVLFFQARWILQGKGKAVRALPWIGLLAWCTVNVLSLHQVERWKYDAPSRHVERLVEATGRTLERFPASRGILFLDPPMRDVRDFERILEVYFKIPPEDVKQVWYFPSGEKLKKRILKPKNEICLRWRESPPSWIPFEPGGWEWLEDWKPTWWPSTLDDPRLSPKIRCLSLAPR